MSNFLKQSFDELPEKIPAEWNEALNNGEKILLVKKGKKILAVTSKRPGTGGRTGHGSPDPMPKEKTFETFKG